MATPAERVTAAVERWGLALVIEQCAAILRSDASQAVDGLALDIAAVLGQLTDREWLAGGRPPGHAYWARVWAARALLYAWGRVAEPAIVGALGDEHWRVREMACKVVAAREVPDAADLIAALVADDIPRVRAAACRALGEVGEGEHADAVLTCRTDSDPSVAAAAKRALDRLSQRLDRSFG